MAVSLSCAACDELEDDVLLAPSGSKFPAPTLDTLVVPSLTLPFQILPVLGCPHAPPFASHFSVIVTPVDTDLTLAEVGLQFLDTTGRVSPIDFREKDLRVLFGTTRVAAGVPRTFPFNATFGCDFQTTPHVMRGRAVFVTHHGRRIERTFERRFSDR
jgi:hypothetical protein